MRKSAGCKMEIELVLVHLVANILKKNDILFGGKSAN